MMNVVVRNIAAILLVMSLGQLLYVCNPDQRTVFRQYEKARIKRLNCESRILFNKFCDSEGVLPRYSDFKLHDPAARDERFTHDYRRMLVKRELNRSLQTRDELETLCKNILADIQNLETTADLTRQILACIDDNIAKRDLSSRKSLYKKLRNLYKGDIKLPENRVPYLNLSDYELTDDESEFLALGLNFHIRPKFDRYRKKLELENLYNDILKLKNDGFVNVNPNLRDQLRAESTKARNNDRQPSIPPRLFKAAKDLKANDDIVIRRADKSPEYVIMNKEEYFDKLGDLISDRDKFEPISRCPTLDIKRELNHHIRAVNTQAGKRVFSEIEGDYSEGYLYGNPKTHKTNTPLRPVISQVLTPTYNTAKQLDRLIKPFQKLHKIRLKCFKD